MKGGLTRQMVAASGLLALVIGTAFAVLFASVTELRDLQHRARQSEEVLVVANRLERVVIDLETGQRGFILTGQEELLEPWRAAQTAFPVHAATLERLLADDPGQKARAQQIARAGTSYIRDYSVPLVQAARRDLAAARTLAATDEGERRIDGLRAEFEGLVATEEHLAADREQASQRVATRAVAVAVGGLAGSILLIAAFAGYLSGAIVRPLREAGDMAGKLAGGDLSVRLSERGVGEIGALERSFNFMATSLEASRAALAASRARIVAATDQARRRIERDLHDGIQQRLVSLVLDLRATEAAAPTEPPELRTELARVADGLNAAMDELREISRGIHPAILSEGGLAPALKALARRSPVAVELDLQVPVRPPEPVEVAAYFVVSEALTNAAKHARATVVHVDVRMTDDSLWLSVRDDGVGDATPERGSGLIGLTDRVSALGGTLSITSPAGEGTTVLVDLPLSARDSR